MYYSPCKLRNSRTTLSSTIVSRRRRGSRLSAHSRLNHKPLRYLFTSFLFPALWTRTTCPSLWCAERTRESSQALCASLASIKNLQIPRSRSMSLVSHSNSLTNSLFTSTKGDVDQQRTAPDSTEAALSTLLSAFAKSEGRFMDRGPTEYSQSGLHSPYPNAFDDSQSEETSADHASAAHYTPQQQEVRPNDFSTSATPTSEYGVYPASARSGSFPEHIQRQYHPASNHSGSSGGMAQPTSPSLPLQDGRPNHHNNQIKSDQDVPIDPSIAASSPTYPSHGGQYSPYPPQQDMQHGYPSHPGGAMYTQPRPDWAGYAGHPQHPMQGGYAVTGAQTPTSAAPAGARPGQVSDFQVQQRDLVGHWVADLKAASQGAPHHHAIPVSLMTRWNCFEKSRSSGS